MNSYSKEEELRLAEMAKRGASAGQVLNNEEYRSAFYEYRAILFERLSSSKEGEEAVRENIWRQLKAIDTVEETLKQRFQDGEFAQEELSAWQKLTQKFKS